MISPMRKQYIESAQHIAIFWHDNPDGDAIGSLLWLGKILENMGKTVSYFTSPSPSRIFDFVPGIHKIKDTFDYKKKYNLIIFVDFSPYARTVFTKGQYDYFDSKPLIIIDHHLGDCPAHAIVLKDSDADSNCEWIFENTKKIRSDWYDSDVATCLYLGIATDTGSFQYDKQWSRSLANAAALVDLWADKWLVTKKIFWTLKLAQLKFMSHIMPRFTDDDGIGYIWYGSDEYKQFALDREEMAGYMTTLISKIEWLKIALIFKIETDCIKISFRSQSPDINGAELAGQFWWGGHFYAAGAKVILELWEDPVMRVKKIVEKIKEIFS
jgi:bifunctional oligoribonuclease and PAP phosphatase NrnA